MGFIRKMLAVSTVGVVRPHSFKQRQAMKQTKYLKRMTKQGEAMMPEKMSLAERLAYDNARLNDILGRHK